MAKADQSLARKREEQVLELRRAGVTFDVIAQQVGYQGREGAYQAWKRAIRRAAPIKNRDEFLEQELDRLDRLHNVFWAKALRGDKDAAQMSVKIGERREALLRSFTPQEDLVIEQAKPTEAAPEPTKLEKLRAIPRPA